MQRFYEHGAGEHSTPERTIATIEIIGTSLPAIRKDLGFSVKGLQPVDMLRSQITDIDKYL